jgi:hypothetical protein
VKIFVETGTNRKGLCLTYEELKMLAVLADMRIMSSKQLYHFISTKKSYTYNSFLNRLKRYEKYKMILSYDLLIGQRGFRYRYHRVSQRCIGVLKQHGFLPEDWERPPYRKLTNRKSIDHALATREFTAVLLASLWKEHRPFQVDRTILTFDKEDAQGEETIIPDQAIELMDRYVYIELDTGTEPFPVIVEKVRKYSRLSEINTNKRHVLYFVVLDASFQSYIPYAENRQRRVSNMKHAILRGWTHHNSNLDIVVVSLSRACKGGKRFIQHDVTTPGQGLPQRLNDLLMHHSTFAERVDMSSFSRKIREKGKLADDCLQILGERWWIIYMKEGDVNRLGRAFELHDWLYRYGDREQDYVLLFYEGKEEREHDALGNAPPQLLAASFEEWQENILRGEPICAYRATWAQRYGGEEE